MLLGHHFYKKGSHLWINLCVINYTLEKIYKAKDVVKNRGVPLGFSVWPDIQIDNWDQYFFFYDGNAQVNVLPKNIFSVKDIYQKLENLSGNDKIKPTSTLLSWST